MTSQTKYNIRLRKQWLNPVGYHLIPLLRDHNIRHIILYGGSSSGKSYSFAQMCLLVTMEDAQSTLIFRKYGTTIEETIYRDFKNAAKQLGINKYFSFTDGKRKIQCVNGAIIVFKGLDDEEKIKGISHFKRIFCDEWNEFNESDDDQLNFRLRGTLGQQRIYAFNPISEQHWIKRTRFDTEEWHDIPMDVYIGGKHVKPELSKVKSIKANSPRKIFNPRIGEYEEHPSDTIAIQSTYLNNFWVVGSPCGTFGFYDRQCIANFEKVKEQKPDQYDVYALGEWGLIMTGSEYFSSFNRGNHCGSVEYDPSLPIHISIDNNYMPYITTTFWQVDYTDLIHIRQLDEVMASPPNNNIRSASKIVAERIKFYHSKGAIETKVILHGDATTRSANTIDEQNRSVCDLFIDGLTKEGIEVIDMVSHTNPSGSLPGEFINAIFDNQFEDVTITIGDSCKTSIDDYLAVQKDANGGMLKIRIKNKTTGQTYEEHGHASDTFKYLTIDILRDKYTVFSNKRKRNTYAKEGTINYFNPVISYEYTRKVVYCIPDINSKCGYILVGRCGDKWHVIDAWLADWTEELHDNEIFSRLLSFGDIPIVMESTPQHYQLARNLRERLTDVRVMKLQSDIEGRIKATTDYVRDHILFNPSKENEDRGYSSFIASLLDYNSITKEKEASAVISGFAKYAIKSLQD